MSGTFAQRLIKSHSLLKYLHLQHWEATKHISSMDSIEKSLLFSFERENDVDSCWMTSSSEDFNPSKQKFPNYKLQFLPTERAISFKGLIKPSEVDEENQINYGYCNLKTKTCNYNPFGAKIFPIWNLELFGNIEVIYHGGRENEIPTCLLNIFTKPSILSLPCIYQVPFQVKDGWNRLVVPFSGLKYYSEEWYDVNKVFDAARVCMFGFNFVAKDLERKFDFTLHSIWASPLLDEFGRVDVKEIWECEEQEYFQIPLSSPIDECSPKEQIEFQKRQQCELLAFSNELR